MKIPRKIRLKAKHILFNEFPDSHFYALSDRYDPDGHIFASTVRSLDGSIEDDYLAFDKNCEIIRRGKLSKALESENN